MQEWETKVERPLRKPFTPEQIALLDALANHDMKGETLCDMVGLGASAFHDAVCELWDRKLLRGIAAEGCCNDPCGSHCISANKPEKVWGLTSLGEMAQRFQHE